MLQVRNLEKIFKGRKGQVQALTPTTFDIAAGEFICLVGASGCGKSTLLNMIAGLEEPTAGEILVDGQSVTGPGQDRGMVFQHYTLFPWLTVLENTEFSEQLECNLDYETLTSTEVEARSGRAESLLEVMGLGDFHNALPRELSGGMKQRVAIARALVNRPKLLLMDEPFGALDAQTREDMQQLLVKLYQEHPCLIVFVTHDVTEALLLGDRVVVLSTQPARVADDFTIATPKPRDSGWLRMPEAAALEQRILSRLHQATGKGNVRVSV